MKQYVLRERPLWERILRWTVLLPFILFWYIVKSLWNWGSAVGTQVGLEEVAKQRKGFIDDK